MLLKEAGLGHILNGVGGLRSWHLRLVIWAGHVLGGQTTMMIDGLLLVLIITGGPLSQAI